MSECARPGDGETAAVPDHRHTVRSELRIWDLRRGDNDDDRTNPHGRGLRSLVFSAVLEFNYLKAPIGFLALFIAPALLLGIIPLVLVDYGWLMLHAPGLAGGGLIVTPIVLLVLAAAGLWLGRPLLRVAWNNCRHLHYCLVLPVFVALRELLRAAAEKWRGRPMTAEQLDRGRRICAVIAALLFAGGGLALAAVVDVSFGVSFPDVMRLRWQPLAAAALGNAAVIIGLASAIESLYWIRRELALDGAVRDWTPSPSPPEAAVVRVAHLSDLHVVGERYGYRMEAGTDGPRGNRTIRSALRKLGAIHASAPLDRVLLTGDVTDAGTRAEWAEFIDLLRFCPELRRRLLLIPGNHDVNIIDRGNPGRLDLPWSAGQSLRKLRVVIALDTLAGDRLHVIEREAGRFGLCLKDFLRQGRRPDLLRELAEHGTMRGRREMTRVWEAIFPLVELPPAGGSYGVILLNSNARSHFALTNAIGVVGPAQLKALRLVLRATRHPWLVLLHHQVVEYPVASISLRERIGLALIDASDLKAVLAPHAHRIIVLHGHRHRDWIGVSGNLVLCSAPSTSLGAGSMDGYRGCFHIHRLAVAAGEVRLIATERVSVA
jgi:3',5'-cyclic AMP phosphodiesterase CpdA